MNILNLGEKIILPNNLRFSTWWKVTGTFKAVIDTGSRLQVMINEVQQTPVVSTRYEDFVAVVEASSVEDAAKRVKDSFGESTSISSIDRFYGVVLPLN